MRIFLCFIIFLANASVEAQALPHDLKLLHNPFWKNKPEAYNKIKIENDILVTAITDSISDKPKLYQMKVVAGGAVGVPLDETFNIIKNYEALPKADSRFRDVKYLKNEDRLFLHMEALGYHAFMHLKLKEVSRENSREIHWECIKGQFLGMKGVFVLEKLTTAQTEISMTADYRAEKLPLPQILMGFGLEVIGRQVAIKMRDYILKQYQGNNS